MKFLLAASGALVILAFGCKRDTSRPSADMSSTTDAATTAPASSRTTVARAAFTPEPIDVDLQALTRRWNDALTQRNAAALNAVYGTRIRLYGATVDRRTAVKMKAAELTDGYTQSIGSIVLNAQDPTHPRALFEKTWWKKGKALKIRGWLGFAKQDGHWVVTSESDAKADSLMLDEHGEDSCLGLVHAAVLSTEDAELFRHPPYGTIYVCGPPECETFQVAGYIIDKNGLQRLSSFDVDPETGVVAHVGTPLAADGAIVSRMKLACNK